MGILAREQGAFNGDGVIPMGMFVGLYIGDAICIKEEIPGLSLSMRPPSICFRWTCTWTLKTGRMTKKAADCPRFPLPCLITSLREAI